MKMEPAAVRLLGARVASVTAPAGFGKTTLMREAAAVSGGPVVWHRTGVCDRDPEVLAGALAEMNWTRLPDGGVLVLDDVHLLADSQQACRVLNGFIDAVPQGLCIWVAGRFALRLASLARLQLSGEVVEIGPADLGHLGWPAAERLGRGLAWDAYVESEVCAHLPDDLRAFATDISLLEQWSPEACDWLLERTGSGEDLAHLERLLPGLAAPHPLLREWLLACLRQQGARHGLLVRRAALWESGRGNGEGALAHALVSGDMGLIAPLLRGACERALRQGRLQDAERWLEQAPAPALEAVPDLLLRVGEALRRAGRPRRSVRWLQSATVGFAAVGEEGGLLRSFCRLTLAHGDLGEWEEAEAAVRQVEAELPVAGRERAEVLLTLAEYGAARGAAAEAERRFREAAALFEEHGDAEGVGAALAGLGASACVAQGRLDDAVQELRRAQAHLAGAPAYDALLAEVQVLLLAERWGEAERAVAAGGPASPAQRAQICWVRARLALQQGDAEGAERLCQEGEAWLEEADRTPALDAAALTARGWVEASRGGAVALARQAHHLAERAAVPLVREGARGLLQACEAPLVRAPVRVQCFGPFRVVAAGREISPSVWGRPQVRSLFQYLLLQPALTAAREAMLAVFWPDESPNLSRARLRVTLNRLRRALQEMGVSLETAAGAVRIPPGALEVDLEQFRQHLSAARAAADPEERILHCRTGRALYRGDLLADAFWPGAEEHRYRAQRDLADLLHLWHEGELRLGRVDEAIAALEELADLEPGREEAVRELIALQLRVGRRGEALRRYRKLERWLKQELGLSPSPETRSVWRTAHN